MVRSTALIAGLLFMALSFEAQAQRADRAQRLDRMDRVQDRMAARDRIADRVAADRVRDRAATDAALREVVDEPVRETDEVADEAPAPATESDSAVIVLDPFGDRIRQGEVLALNPSAEARAELARRNLREVRQRPLSDNAVLYLFRSPGAVNLGEVLSALQTVDPAGLYAPNHVFEPNSEPPSPIRDATALGADPQSADCTIGLIDGPVQALPATYQSMITKTQRFDAGRVSDSSHGAVVAYRLIDTIEQFGRPHPISICAADVFDAGAEPAITAESIAAAVNWQMRQGVQLVNASLAGPHNDIVAWSVSRFTSTGGTLVAAVGNGGPLSRNIYPAAYDDVIGVTAVDATGQLYAFASQGDHVDIAARGVDIDVSHIGIEAALSGTSFAAPFVTGWMAVHGAELDQAGPVLIDHGELGRDTKFGRGELKVSSGAGAVRTSRALSPDP